MADFHSRGRKDKPDPAPASPLRLTPVNHQIHRIHLTILEAASQDFGMKSKEGGIGARAEFSRERAPGAEDRRTRLNSILRVVGWVLLLEYQGFKGSRSPECFGHYHD